MQRQEKSEKPTGPKRSLGTDELEILAKTLQKIVKHRGGGPFGKGRLEGLEADELETFLLDTLNILRPDGLVGTHIVDSVPTSASTPGISVTSFYVSILIFI